MRIPVPPLWAVVLIFLFGLPVLGWIVSSVVGLMRVALMGPSGRRRSKDFIDAAERLLGAPTTSLDEAERKLMGHSLREWTRLKPNESFTAADFLRSRFPGLAIANHEFMNSRGVPVEGLLFRDGGVTFRMGMPITSLPGEFEAELTQDQLRKGIGPWLPEQADAARQSLDLEERRADEQGRPMRVVLLGLESVRFVQEPTSVEATYQPPSEEPAASIARRSARRESLAISSARRILTQRQQAEGERPWFPERATEQIG